ncbi:MAG TPA: Pls/PosA family non-ribosomal peptide synthetase, partial [Arthrobacter sp.]|nr:Pls/PosA family non-ribosomal peptide synthetase [Arthrobacter sp.]
DGVPVRWGEEGELIIGGVGLGRYLDPAKDAEKYAPLPALGWDRAYRSGDLVLADPDGLIFVGRADEQVKLGGRRVELGEIDRTLAELDQVAAAAAAVQATPSGNQLLAGYLVPAEGADIDLAAARDRLTEVLPAQLVPVLSTIDELPVKTSGKVDRKALPWPLIGAETDAGPALSGTAAWLAGVWQDLLGPAPLSEDSDFFARGGASVAAAHLVAALRVRYAEVSIADIYARPTLGSMARYLDSLNADAVEERHLRPVPWWTGLFQAPLILALYGIIGLRYVVGMAVVCMVLVHTTEAPWVPDPPVLPTVLAWVVLYTLPFRAALSVVSARVLLWRIRPGAYRRGGSTHLRLWAVERITNFCKLDPMMGTPLATWYGRALGCRIGRNVHLDALPPVTGLAVIGSGASIEYETDLAGHWLDGDTLQIGRIRIDGNARVGTRSTLLGGAHVGSGAEVEPGTCVTGHVPDGERWAGSQMERVGAAGEGWPAGDRTGRTRLPVALLYPISLFGLTLMPIIAVVPGALLMLGQIHGITDLETALWTLAAWAPVFVTITLVVFLALTAGIVRLLSRLLKPGFHPAHGISGWAAWLTNVVLAKCLVSVYPLYASLITPAWLRLLGARVGRHVEISTMETVPHLTSLESRSFLADHSLVSAFRVRKGWLHLGESSVGEKSFVGNSGVVGPDVHVPEHSLIAVLSSAPPDMPPSSNWFGRPPVELPRPADSGNSTRTYEPPARLIVARASVEVCRLLPVTITAWLALATVWILAQIYFEAGLTMAAILSGPVLLGAALVGCLTALTAKWALIGRFQAAEHPLWSSFVWRNELADVFSESLAVAGVIRMSLGTPMFNAWLRLMGTKVGRRVWCESWWLPEFDLISLGDGVTVNRGTVLQTHLFHDRIMRMDEVRLDDYSTLGPNSVVLPGSRLSSHATVGAGSLVMRSEVVPPAGRWAGNPLRKQDPEAGPDRTGQPQRPAHRATAAAGADGPQARG